MQKRIECLVTGRVQMVMYRDFVTRSAKKLGVVGEVWNNKDGTVSVIAEGDEEVIALFVNRLERGSLLARVEGVEVLLFPAKNSYTNFTIRFD